MYSLVCWKHFFHIISLCILKKKNSTFKKILPNEKRHLRHWKILQFLGSSNLLAIFNVASRFEYCFAHSKSYDTYIQKEFSLKVVVFLCVAFKGWATVAFSASTVRALHLATMNRPIHSRYYNLLLHLSMAVSSSL